MIRFLCRPLTAFVVLVVGTVAMAVVPVDSVHAQQATPNITQSTPLTESPTSNASESGVDSQSINDRDSLPADNGKRDGLNLLVLLRRGGWFMVPLALISLLVVAVAIERSLALRQSKILPANLVRSLGNLGRSDQGFDPARAFRTCQANPSAASRVLRVMFLKAGRPQAEIERAVTEATEREATRCQTLVSWLTLAAAVAPLIGLLGTVWGMIQAFYDTTQLVAGQNKAEILAQGIYTALVTTLCGLIIAIPSAVLAHFYDNRIVGWFQKVEELTASLMPMMEPLEGQVRVSSQTQFSNRSRQNNPEPSVGDDHDGQPGQQQQWGKNAAGDTGEAIASPPTSPR